MPTSGLVLNVIVCNSISFSIPTKHEYKKHFNLKTFEIFLFIIKKQLWILFSCCLHKVFHGMGLVPLKNIGVTPLLVQHLHKIPLPRVIKLKSGAYNAKRLHKPVPVYVRPSFYAYL